MNKKENWANEVLGSLEELQRATPRDDLFNTILANLPKDNLTKVIPLKNLRWLAIAASVIIALNFYSSLSLFKHTGNSQEQTNYQSSLLSDYNIYKQTQK